MTKKQFYLMASSFVALQAVLYYFMLFGEGQSGGDLHGNLSRYAPVVLSLAFSLCFIEVKKVTVLINLGLVFTVVADYFLILSDPIVKEPGVLAFSVTQLCYFAYLYFLQESKKARVVGVIARIALIVVAEAVTLIFLGDKTDFLSVITVFYISNFVVNIAIAFTMGKSQLFFAIALCLFVMCDLFVGFSVAIGDYFNISSDSWFYKLIYSDFDFIWFFYAPSQVMIALKVMIDNKMKSIK